MALPSVVLILINSTRTSQSFSAVILQFISDLSFDKLTSNETPNPTLYIETCDRVVSQ